MMKTEKWHGDLQVAQIQYNCHLYPCIANKERLNNNKGTIREIILVELRLCNLLGVG